METQRITIEVNADVARAYNSVSDEQRSKINALLSLKLSEAVQSNRSLEETMSQLSRGAKKRGLTKDILDNILQEK